VTRVMGRGLFQITDRFHGDWLDAHGAAGRPRPRGWRTPPTSPRRCSSPISPSPGRKAFPRRISSDSPASAYNAGAGGALAGQQSGDCDRKTTGGDYGRDVLERLGAIQHPNGGRSLAGERRPNPSEGGPGQGRREIKRDLQTWFDRAAPGVWQTFRVRPGPVFGGALAGAVREFQMRNGCSSTVRSARTPGAPSRGSLPRSRDRRPRRERRAGTGILRRGDRGSEVTRLKRDLEAWFEHALPGTWESFGVAAGPCS
jgi:hypothetical protein